MPINQEISVPSSLKSIQPIKEIHGMPVYADNPFLENFGIIVKKKSSIVASGLQITDTNQGEVACGVVGMIKEVDIDNFIKFYSENLSSLFDLSPAAIKVLVILLYELQKSGKDKAEIFFSYPQAEEYCKKTKKLISKATFSRGLRELIQENFIAKSSHGISCYWTNPSIIFNGDRVRFIKEYRLKRKEEKKLEK